MGSLTSSCVRDCVRTSHEYASEDLLHVSAEGQAPGLQSSSSRAPSGATAKAGSAFLSPRNPPGGAAAGVVPPVPNWFQVLRDGRQGREGQTETPRFDEVIASPAIRNDQITPRGIVGGEFRTPGPTPRESPRTSEGQDANNLGSAKPDEVSYEGMYLGTMKHGLGKQRMSNSSYDGEFQNDLKHGTGVLTWDDGRQYRGGFEVNKFHGQAVMTWPDGRRYTGRYADDRKHGEGTFSWQDGRRYQGQWVSGKRHGVGIYTNAKGLTRRGMWQMDRPLHWELPGAEVLGLGAPGAEATPRDAVRLEVAVAKAAERITERRVPLASPREAEEEAECDLEIKVSNL